MYRTTKELIEREKKEIRALDDESDRIDYLIKTYGRTTRLTIEQEEVRQFISNAHYEFNRLQWRYQEEQRQAETKKRLQAEIKRRQQAKSKELQKATHEIVYICSSIKDEISSIKDDLIDLLAHIRAEKEHGKKQEEAQEQENEDVRHSGVVNNCDVSLQILEATKVEPTVVCESLEATGGCDQSVKRSKIAQVESEIACEETSEDALDLLATEEKLVRENYPIQVDHIEFVISDRLLQPFQNPKVVLSTILFPKVFELYRVKTSSLMFHNVFSGKRSSWFIISFYKTRGRVFSNKGRNDGDQIQVCNYLCGRVMYLIIYEICVILGVR